MADGEEYRREVEENNSTTSESKVVLSAIMASGSASVRGTLSLTTTLAANHIQAAALFARQAAAIERTHDVSAGEEVRADHRAYVIGAVFAAVAFLEAFINEFFELNPAKLPNLPTNWEQQAKHAARRKGTKEILAKYLLALDLSAKPHFDVSTDKTLTDADVLISLRNNLVHYKPTKHTVISEPVPVEELPELERLLSGRFAVMNPLYPPNSHFLHEFLNHACAQWAVEVALKFADDFYARIGLQPSYAHVRGRLATE